jgi:hypothetical protein
MPPPLFLALTLLFSPCLVPAQVATGAVSAPDKQGDYNKIVAHFFAMVKAGRFTDAAHVLVDTNPADAFNVEKHESVAVPLERVQDAFGAFRQFDPLVDKTLGDSVGYVYGLAIYEREPIRYEFIFYKDGPDWRLLHIDFNLNYIPEIRELAGVHIPLAPSYIPAPRNSPGPTPPQQSAAPAPVTPVPEMTPKTPDHPQPPVLPALSTPAATPVQPAVSPVAPSHPPADKPAPSPAAAPPVTDPPALPAPQK